MTTTELFPSWEPAEVAFFDKHYHAIVTVANFMARDYGWDSLVMIERLLRNCVKSEAQK